MRLPGMCHRGDGERLRRRRRVAGMRVVVRDGADAGERHEREDRQFDESFHVQPLTRRDAWVTVIATATRATTPITTGVQFTAFFAAAFTSLAVAEIVGATTPVKNPPS